MVRRTAGGFPFRWGFRPGRRDDASESRSLGARRGVARGQDAFGRLEFVGHVEQQFARRGQRGRIVGERDAHALLRRGFQSVDDAPAEGRPVAEHLPMEVVVFEAAEEIFVEDLHRIPRIAGPRGPDRLVVVAHLLHVWVRNAVGTDQAVVAEVLVRGVVGVPVASVAVDRHAVAPLFVQRLVHEIPDESALIFRFAADQLPVLPESAHRVAHGVGVFALDQRFGGILGEVFLTPLVVPVHRADNVRVAAAGRIDGPFVVNRPRGVVSLDPVVAGVEVRPVARFVAQRPDDDRRMVDAALHVAFVALQMRLGVERILGQRLFAVTHAVRLDIGLGHDVESVLVAERVPAGVVGVVARAHGVDVVLLHDADVLQHAPLGDVIAVVGVHLMPVGALDQHRPAVDEQLPALDLHVAESDPERNDLDHFARRRAERRRQSVQHGRLGAPQGDFPGVERAALLVFRDAQLLRRDAAPLGVGERQFDAASPRLPGEEGFDGYRSRGVVGRRRGVDLNVRNLPFVARVEVAVAAHARKAEEVLIFEVCAVAPAEDLERDEIPAGFHVGRQVELGLQLAVLAVTHIAAVDPEVDVRRHRAEMRDDLPAGPCRGDVDRTAVGTHVVLLDGNVRRIVFEPAPPGVTDVEVDRIAVSVQLPESRHGHVVPAFVVVADAEKVRRSLVGVAHPVEFPVSVQRDEPLREGLVARLCGFRRFVREPGAMHRHSVHGIHAGVLPFVALRAGRQRRRRGQPA